MVIYLLFFQNRVVGAFRNKTNAVKKLKSMKKDIDKSFHDMFRTETVSLEDFQ